ncbi:MAG: hypothetical protein ACP5HQ_07290 [Thermoprotei archaeon]
MKNEVEVFLSIPAYREVMKGYRLVDYTNEWSVVEGFSKLYTKEFKSYAIVVDYYSDPDVLESLSEGLDTLDELRPSLMRPNFFYDSVSFVVRGDEIVTLPSLSLEWFPGQDLVNPFLRAEGVEIRREEDCYSSIAVKVARPLTKEMVNEALRKMSLALAVYERVREAQEDVAVRLAKEIAEKKKV